MKALVFGSLNIDYVYRVPAFVQRGETLASTSLRRFSGGKGLNQAIALSRAGMETCMAGAVGEDGAFLLNELESAGVETSLVRMGTIPTGHAIIQNTPDGDNGILLFGGANRTITADQVKQVLEQFGKDDLLLVQNEISCLPEIMSLAKERGMIVALNPSPMEPTLIRSLLPYTDLLILNRIEASQLLDDYSLSAENALKNLMCLSKGIQVLLTLGADGALFARGEETLFQSAYSVEAVDTTGAGDTFTGFFLAGLFLEADAAFALRYAAAAAALSVTRAGAAPSIPRREETLRFMDLRRHDASRAGVI